MRRLFRAISAVEVVQAQHLNEPAIEIFDYAAGLWCLELSQPVLNAQRQAQVWQATTLSAGFFCQC